MKCPKCESEALYLIDGKCKLCKEQKRRKRGNYKGRRSSPNQTRETLGLRRKCDLAMGVSGESKNAFAKRLKLTPSAFYRWFNGEFTEPRQPSFNAKVRKSLEQGRFEEVTNQRTTV